MRDRILFFQDLSVTGAAIHPTHTLRARVFVFATPTNQSGDHRDVRQSDDADVRPKAEVLRHRYFDSARVAIPTFMICARCNASIKVINFCTGKSRSGRITTATSELARLISVNCAVSESRSMI